MSFTVEPCLQLFVVGCALVQHGLIDVAQSGNLDVIARECVEGLDVVASPAAQSDDGHTDAVAGAFAIRSDSRKARGQ
jgi:hypothetical protein